MNRLRDVTEDQFVYRVRRQCGACQELTHDGRAKVIGRDLSDHAARTTEGRADPVQDGNTRPLHADESLQLCYVPRTPRDLTSVSSIDIES